MTESWWVIRCTRGDAEGLYWTGSRWGPLHERRMYPTKAEAVEAAAWARLSGTAVLPVTPPAGEGGAP